MHDLVRGIGDISLFSIDTQATAFDARAARGSLSFMKEALGEINESLSCCAPLEKYKQSGYTLNCQSNSFIDIYYNNKYNFLDTILYI